MFLEDLVAGRLPVSLEQVEELRGQSLACWCPPGDHCHAELLLRLANAGGGLR